MEYQQAQYADLPVTEYAGVWVRFLATLIDGIIMRLGLSARSLRTAVVCNLYTKE
jgi:hypothetical protein